MIDADARLIRDHADRIRSSGALGRSDLLSRLFDFLLDASLDGRTPKETELAEALLARGGDSDAALDGSVRVAVHRLRRKLDDFYAGAREQGQARLVIPRGSYRLELVGQAEASPAALIEEESAATADTEQLSSKRSVIAGAFARRSMLALLLLFAVAGWALALLKPSAGSEFAAIRGSALWAPLAGSARPTFIVVGDFYIFGEVGKDRQIQRLVREFAINSPADLDEYLKFSPEMVEQYRDLQLSYLPTGTGGALRSLVPIVDAAIAPGAPRATLISMSELTPEILKGSNIIYVGYLSRLGLIRDPLFAASRFEVGASYDELVDERTGTRYLADGPSGARRAASRDYGYLAAFPGPTGNRLIVIAGTRDAALMQTAEIAADAEQIARAAPGAADAFEALYAVGALGNLNVTSKLALAGPMQTARMWGGPADSSNGFPDELRSAPR